MNDILADMETENIYNSYEEARDEKEIAEARRKKRIRFVGIGIAVLVVLSLLVGGVDALSWDMQNPNSQEWTCSGLGGTCTYPGHPHEDTILRQLRRFCDCSNHWCAVNSTTPSYSNYWSIVSRSDSLPASCSLYISFYNESYALIDTSNDLASNFSYAGHYELLKSGNSIALYCDGVYKCDIGGTYIETPYYIKIQSGTSQCCGSGYTYFYLDDVMTDEALIATFPHTWNITRNWDNPAVNGLYDGTTKKYTHKFHTSYAWHNVTSFSDRNSPADSIITKYFYTGEIVNTTSLTIQSADIIEYNLTDMLFHDDTTDDKYGLYYQELKRDGETLAQDCFWFDYDSASKPSGGTISFDKDSYVTGETAPVTHHLDSPDFANYYYKGYIYDMNTAEQKTTWSISNADGTEDVDLAGYDAGQYFAILRIDDKSSDFEYDMAFDTCAVNEELMIEGITYNAETGAVLGTVNASFLQGTQYYNATSNTTTGEYNVSGLSVDISTDVNATKTNYTHNDFSFTPLQVDLYEVDVFMLPNITYISFHNTSIGGLVQSSPFYQNVSEATVNIWNATWNDAATANSMGYYIFENLTNGTYSINASSAGYLTSSNEEIETNNGSFLYHYILLEPQFILTIKARDASSHATITDFIAIVNDGTPQDTTNGSIDFTVGYGIQKVEASAEGYYASLEYVYVDEDTEEIMYLTPLEGAGGTGLYYPPPHLVEFRVQNVWGKTYSDASVIAQGYEITHQTSWLASLFGYENATEIYSEQMNGTTDSNGQLSFMMVETIKYQINVSDTESPARFDDKTFWIYPKDERYNLVVSGGITWQKAGTEEQKELSINVTTNTINDTHAYINVSYSDPSNKTTNLTIYVNHTINNNEEECLNSSNWVNTSVQNYSYIVTPYKGYAFKIEVVTEHEGWGSRTWTYAKRFPGMLIDLGLPDVAYPMIAVAVLLFLGGVFGRSSATQGSLVICFGGWFFWAIGFLTMINSVVMLSALSLASVVSIIAIMMEKSRKTGVQ